MMKLDPHIHSSYSSDGKTTPKDILIQAKKIGLDVLAISDHDTIKGSKIAIEEIKNLKDNNILVIPSIEISSNKGHILGFGVDEHIPKDLDPFDTIDQIHDKGGIAIIPHPYSFYRHGLFSKLSGGDGRLSSDLDIEAIETKNARYLLGYSNYKSKKIAIKRNLAEIGSSDSHFADSIGNCYTELIDIDFEPSIDDVIEAIKSKKTKPHGNRTSNYLIAKEVFNKKILKKY